MDSTELKAKAYDLIRQYEKLAQELEARRKELQDINNKINDSEAVKVEESK